jgi:hypothetical protein
MVVLGGLVGGLSDRRWTRKYAATFFFGDFALSSGDRTEVSPEGT